jgi:hypothetical protein
MAKAPDSENQRGQLAPGGNLKSGQDDETLRKGDLRHYVAYDPTSAHPRYGDRRRVK